MKASSICKIVSFALVILALAGCAKTNNSRIAFSSDHDNPSDLEIYAMNGDGSDLVRLTNSLSMDALPQWSPDGQKIAFSSNRSDEYDLYVMSSDGGDVLPIKYDKGCISGYWLPDSQRMVFTCAATGIIAVNVDGSGKTHLFDLPFKSDGVLPSPNGSRFFFISRDTTSGGLYTVASDGKDVTLIARSEYEGRYAIWSPDSRKIAFTAIHFPNTGIYAVNADGTQMIRLTQHSDDKPIWSPDGRKIAFVSTRGGPCGIYVMDADGSRQTLLTDDGIDCDYVRISWSPDSKRIAFQSNRNYTHDVGNQIYAINVEDSTVVRLTNRTGNDIDPIWSP